MLTEIYCEKFMDGEKPRGPIRFHKGLNVVLGDQKAENSIGKTTFLLAIDFALGGDQYVHGSDNMLQMVGDHEICSTYEFDGVERSYLRSTAVPGTVWKCDRKYNKLSPMDVADFKDELGALFGMDGLGDKFGTLMSPFMRIFGLPHDTVWRPLQAFASESAEKQLRRLLMLYGRYLPVAELEEKYDDAKSKASALNQAREYRYVAAPKKFSEFKQVKKRISELQNDIDEIYASAEMGTLDAESINSEHIAVLKSELRQLRTRRTKLRGKLRGMEDSLEMSDFRANKDFEELTDFFPGVDLKHIEEIEQFHAAMTKILRRDYKEEVKSLKAELELLDASIEEKEDELSEAGPISSLPKSALDKMGRLAAEQAQLKAASDVYVRGRELEQTKKEIKREREDKEMRSFREIENSLNEELIELSEIAAGTEVMPPRISIKKTDQYTFSIPNDGGAGSKNRAVFLLDVALLDQTPLPLVIHDSVGIKQVGDKRTVGLFEVYARTNKQVFATIDKAQSYTNDGEVPDVFKKNTVLELSDGHELFGWSWNKRVPRSSEEANSDE